MKQIIAGLLAFLFLGILVLTPFITVEATEEPEAQPEIISGHKFYEQVLPAQTEELLKKTKGVHFGAGRGEYAKYTNDLMYNRMTFDEKALYNTLYWLCENYLTGTENLSYDSRYANYFTEKANYEGLSRTRAKEVALIFDVCNPQFYFLSDSVLVSSYSGTQKGYLELSVYPDFADGQARRTATAMLFAKINEFEAAAAQEATPPDKVRKVHDMICDQVTYDENADQTGVTERHQSCYTAFMEGISVCAGYSESAEMLLNAVGVPTIAVTSEQHEWNQVFIDGFWYLMDVTWDDQEFGRIYQYYLKSDDSAKSISYRSRIYHTKETLWGDFDCPPCRFDYGTAPASASIATENPLFIFTDRVEIGDNSGVPPGASQMYRLYNRNSGEHFYTSNSVEAEGLKNVGWRYEGRAWIAPNLSTVPVYRLYNPNAGEHHYTINAIERVQLIQKGWRNEGVGWYSDDNHGITLYRVYNKNQFANNHFYTMNEYEKNTLVNAGWRDEGIAWYGL